jgi:hypothetical protein
LRIPATAQSLVQVDRTGQLREAVGDQRLLRAEQLTLGIEEGQVAVDPDAVATLGQTVVILVGLNEVTLRLQLLGVGLACGQAVGDFLEGRLNGLLVVRHANVLLDLRRRRGWRAGCRR